MSKIVSAEALKKSLSEEPVSVEKVRGPTKATSSPQAALGSPVTAAVNKIPQRAVITTPKSPRQASVAASQTKPSGMK